MGARKNKMHKMYDFHSSSVGGKLEKVYLHWLNYLMAWALAVKTQEESVGRTFTDATSRETLFVRLEIYFTFGQFAILSKLDLQFQEVCSDEKFNSKVLTAKRWTQPQ